MWRTTFIICAISSVSYGLPLQQSEQGGNYGRPYNSSTGLVQTRGGHRRPGPLDPAAGDRSVSKESHAQDSRLHQSDHHHDHDPHKGTKLSKQNIQQYITQRDLEKHKRGESTWKLYFAEILAASILVIVIGVFLCWWNWTRRGRQRSGHGGITPREKRRNQRQQQPFQRGQSMPELYINNLNLSPGSVGKAARLAVSPVPGDRRKSYAACMYQNETRIYEPTNV